MHGTYEDAGTRHEVVIRVSARDSVKKGQVIRLTVDPSAVHVFDTATEERLSD